MKPIRKADYNKDAHRVEYALQDLGKILNATAIVWERGKLFWYDQEKIKQDFSKVAKKPKIYANELSTLLRIIAGKGRIVAYNYETWRKFDDLEDLLDSEIPKRTKPKHQKLKVVQSEWDQDWFFIEPVSLRQIPWFSYSTGAAWECFDTIRIYTTRHDNNRLASCKVEGSLAELKAIGEAIKKREDLSFYRIAVEFVGNTAYLWSPRNCPDNERGWVPIAVADQVAKQIENLE